MRPNMAVRQPVKVTGGGRLVVHAFLSGMAASVGFLVFLMGYAALAFWQEPFRLLAAVSHGGVIRALAFYGLLGLPFLFLAGLAVGPLFSVTSHFNRLGSALLAVPVGILGSTIAVGLLRMVLGVQFSAPMLLAILVATVGASFLHGGTFAWWFAEAQRAAQGGPAA